MPLTGEVGKRVSVHTLAPSRFLDKLVSTRANWPLGQTEKVKIISMINNSYSNQENMIKIQKKICLQLQEQNVTWAAKLCRLHE